MCLLGFIHILFKFWHTNQVALKQITCQYSACNLYQYDSRINNSPKRFERFRSPRMQCCDAGFVVPNMTNDFTLLPLLDCRRHYGPLKCRQRLTQQNGVTSQKTWTFWNTAVRLSNLAVQKTQYETLPWHSVFIEYLPPAQVVFVFGRLQRILQMQVPASFSFTVVFIAANRFNRVSYQIYQALHFLTLLHIFNRNQIWNKTEINNNIKMTTIYRMQR